MPEYNCEICEYTTKKKSSYDNHMKSKKHINKVNGIEKPTIYKCVECDKTFKHQSAYSRHKNIHKDNKKFSCNLCLTSYRDFATLNRHFNSNDHCRKLGKINEREIAKLNIMEYSKEDLLNKKAQIRKNNRILFGSSLMQVKKYETKISKEEAPKQEDKKECLIYNIDELDELLYTEHKNKECKKLIEQLLKQLKDTEYKNIVLEDLKDEEPDYTEIKENLIDTLKDEL